MSGFVLLAIAYVSLVIFAITAFCRTFKVARMPVHLRWELAPVPHEKGKGHYGGSYFEEYEWWDKPRERSLVSEFVYMFKEIVFLKGVWENNRRLWFFSFPFHFGMYLLITTAAVFSAGAILQLMGVRVLDWAWLRTALTALAAAGYALGAIGAVGLLITRLTDPRLQAFRTAAALFNLVFLAAIFLTGAYALIALGDFPRSIAGFLRALFTADGASVDAPGYLTAHLVLVFLFMAYLPFTQMLHFVAKYFTYHRVRWDDEALTPRSGMEKEVLQLLKQPVTWSGPHLQADGRKNWVDIATGEVKE
jgi:nitrate reductase gamma subunit